MSERKILIVDDEAALRETLRDLFEDEGFAVDVAADGDEGLSALRTHGPHALVVLDLVMPNMDGVEMLRQMRQDSELAAIPVVICTSRPAGAPAGIVIMRKPVDVNVLLNTAYGLLHPTLS
jgi:CheY-like chemotaxis protein